jgi:hypothetical protein
MPAQLHPRVARLCVSRAERDVEPYCLLERGSGIGR